MVMDIEFVDVIVKEDPWLQSCVSYYITVSLLSCVSCWLIFSG
jgi:hypothetical protein